MYVYGLILLNVFLLVTGQILWKMGLDRMGGLTTQNWTGLFTSPLIWGGLALYVVATGVWFLVLSRTRLSMAYPMQSIAYVLGMVAGLVFFGESIPIRSWLGVALVMAGVGLIGWR